jgi:putative transposase
MWLLKISWKNKIGLFYLKKYNSINELKTEIKEYIIYNINERIKSKLKGISPIQYRAHNYQNKL